MDIFPLPSVALPVHTRVMFTLMFVAASLLILIGIKKARPPKDLHRSINTYLGRE